MERGLVIIMNYPHSFRQAISRKTYPLYRGDILSKYNEIYGHIAEEAK